MCGTAPKLFGVLCRVSYKRWNHAFRARVTIKVVMAQYTEEIDMNKEQVKGRVEEVKGKIKEVTGHVVGNKDLEESGTAQKDAGKVLADLGDYAADVKSHH